MRYHSHRRALRKYKESGTLICRLDSLKFNIRCVTSCDYDATDGNRELVGMVSAILVYRITASSFEERSPLVLDGTGRYNLINDNGARLLVICISNNWGLKKWLQSVFNWHLRIKIHPQCYWSREPSGSFG